MLSPIESSVNKFSFGKKNPFALLKRNLCRANFLSQIESACQNLNGANPLCSQYTSKDFTHTLKQHDTTTVIRNGQDYHYSDCEGGGSYLQGLGYQLC